MAALEDLIKTTKEENAKTRALNEKLASGRRENNQFASNEEITVAKESLKKEDDLISLQKRTLNISSARFEEARELGIAIKAQETVMKEQSDSLELLGITASEDDNYKKEEQKLAKMQLQLAKTTGSKDAEKGAKDKLGENKMLTYMKNTAGFLGGIAKQGMQKVKSGLQGFSKFAFGALAIAALAFLNSPQFDKYYNQIMKVIIPALSKLYHKVILPLAKIIKEKLGPLFGDILLAIDGEKSWTEVLKDNLLTIGLIGAALAPSLLFGTVLTGVKTLGSLIKAGYTTKAVTEFMAGSGGKVVGAGLILGGVALAITDAISGWAKAEDWGVSKTSGAIGGALAGMNSGIEGAFKNAGKYALIGAGIGSIFPVIGTAIGGAVGALIGAVLGYFGGEKVAKAFDEMGKVISEAWDTLYSAISDSIAGIFDGIKSIFGGGKRMVKDPVTGKQVLRDAEQKERTPEQLARDARNEVRDEDKKLRRNDSNQRTLKNRIDMAQRDVDKDDSDRFFLPESVEEQQEDRLRLQKLEKELVALKMDREKMLASTNVISDSSVKVGGATNNTTQQMMMMTQNNPVLNLIGT